MANGLEALNPPGYTNFGDEIVNRQNNFASKIILNGYYFDEKNPNGDKTKLQNYQKNMNRGFNPTEKQLVDFRAVIAHEIYHDLKGQHEDKGLGDFFNDKIYVTPENNEKVIERNSDKVE